MQKSPVVSILMPAYNCENFIRSSVGSMLSQTFKDFELIVINDGSTDKTLEILKSFKDRRLTIIEKENNEGYVKALNDLIPNVKGEFIARMDADDFSRPMRLEAQVKALREDESIGVCGTSYRYNAWRRIRQIKVPTSSDDVFVSLLFENPIAHPTTMIRKSVFDTCGLYNKEFEYIEDLDFWDRVSRCYKMINLSKDLFIQRRHSSQVSVTKASLQKKRLEAIRTRQLKILDSTFTEEEVKIFIRLSLLYRWDLKGSEPTIEDINAQSVASVLKKLHMANQSSRIYHPTLLQRKIKEMWLRFLERTTEKVNTDHMQWLTGENYLTQDRMRIYFMRNIRQLCT